MADTAIRILDVMGAFGFEYIEGNDIKDNWLTFDPKAMTKEDMLFAMVGAVCSGGMFTHAKNYFSNLLYLVSCYCRHWDYDLWGALTE